MAARITRQQVREQARKAFEESLDRMIPADENKPLKGRRFGDWEEQLEQVICQFSPVLLQGRAALEDNAEVEQAGRCPYCAAENTYLEKQTVVQPRQGPHGTAELPLQQARCRACNGSFSPSTARLGAAGRSPADEPGRPADQSGSRNAVRRRCGPRPQ